MELNKEKQYRKENDAYMMKQVDEKVYNLRIELTKEKKIREEDEDRVSMQINQQYNALKDEIENEKRRRFSIDILFIITFYFFYREENTEILINKLGDDILKLQEMLNYEKKV